MRRSFWKCLVILCLCVLGVFLFSHCGKEKKGPSTTLAPDFTLKTLDGKEITLSKLKGKVVLIDFWATWCSPCRESIPHLVQLYKNYQKNGLELIGMNVDKGDLNAVLNFVKSMDIPYPIAITPDAVMKDFGVLGLPTTILIDKEGKVRDKITGFNSEIAKQMVAKIEDLTAEKP